MTEQVVGVRLFEDFEQLICCIKEVVNAAEAGGEVVSRGVFKSRQAAISTALREVS